MSNFPSAVSLALSSERFTEASCTDAGLTEASFTEAQLGDGQSPIFFQAILESMMQGVLIVNEQRQIIQLNRRGQELCEMLRGIEPGKESGRKASYGLHCISTGPQDDCIPDAIWRVCQALLSSRQEFPEYQVIPEEELEISDTTHLKVYAQWLDWTESETSYMLVTLEDRSEMLRNLARWDARRYDLTAREAEVWMLKCQGYSYDDIADELYISRNTVKKHLKSINFKRESSVL